MYQKDVLDASTHQPNGDHEHKTVLLSSLTDIQELQDQISLVRRLNVDEIRIKHPQINPTEVRRWTGQFNNNLRDCGCQTGSIFTLIFLVAYLLFVLEKGYFSLSLFISVGALVVTTSALLGKMIGKSIARLGIRRDLNHLSLLFESENN
ncbi:MAG: hypothetical protein ACRBF0_13910 [Calditrichia bacterium]